MNVASLIVQIIIAAFLIWYTIETYKLRREAANQRIIAIQPIIDFVYNPKDNPNILTLENVGPGPALNLQLYCWMPESSIMTQSTGFDDIAAIYEDASGNTYYTIQCGRKNPLRLGKL